MKLALSRASWGMYVVRLGGRMQGGRTPRFQPMSLRLGSLQGQGCARAIQRCSALSLYESTEGSASEE